MDEVISILTQTVSNGAVDWDTFVGSVPVNLKRHLMPAIRQLEQDGVLHRHIDGTVQPPVFSVRPGARPTE